MTPEGLPAVRGPVFESLTGRPAEGVTGTGSVRSMLIAAFGAGRGKTGVNTSAAAAEFNVSARTVQRWVAGEGKQRIVPKGDRLAAIGKAARQAASTQQGRRRASQQGRQQAVAAARRGKPNQTVPMYVSGVQGMGYPGGDRQRTCPVNMTPEQIEALYEAYERTGDAGAVAFIESRYNANYVAGWQMETIDSISFGEAPR